MLIHGNSARIPLTDGSVHMAVTSPPYWALRDYGLEPTAWPEVTYTPMVGVSPAAVSGWRGCLGLEPTPELFVAHVVLVMREVWRVLRDDAVCWMNLGDSYAGSWGNYGGHHRGNGAQREITTGSRILQRAYTDLADWRPPTATAPGLKPKDLCMIPARVALALQADGWWLRSDPPWLKDNPMPESVKDRPTKAHEYLFLLTKSERYYYDHEAVRMPIASDSVARVQRGRGESHKWAKGGPGHQTIGYDLDGAVNPQGRNRRTTDWFDYDAAIASHAAYIAHLRHVRDAGGLLTAFDTGLPVAFHVNPHGYSGAHFATFPPELVAPCILAGTSQRVCPVCGAPWERVVERGQPIPRPDNPNPVLPYTASSGHSNGTGKTTLHRQVDARTIGWQLTCDHDGDPVPAVVLDPFCGSATVGQVCRETGRRFVGLDLNATYLRELALPRAAHTQTPTSMQALPLFAGAPSEESV